MVCGKILRGPLFVALAALIGLSACGAIGPIGQQRPEFDGQTFRSKLSRGDRADRQNFAVEVGPVSASFAGALEAGRFEGTRYCIETFGTSDILWERGPDDDPETLPVVSDRLSFRGRCVF